MEMKFPMSNIKHIKAKGIHFLWYTKRNGQKRAIHWECQSPIWIKPRFEINKSGWRAGWLWLAIGYCSEPL